MKEKIESEMSDMMQKLPETMIETEQSKTGFSIRFNSEVEIIQINSFRDRSKVASEL